jgi:hypothetical protein
LKINFPLKGLPYLPTGNGRCRAIYQGKARHGTDTGIMGNGNIFLLPIFIFNRGLGAAGRKGRPWSLPVDNQGESEGLYMETKHQEHEYCGECIFCVSKCPECGYTEIDVDFKVVCMYGNFKEDVIDRHQSINEIELKCRKCGESFKDDEYGRDERLSALSKAIEDVHVAHVIRLTHKEGGELDVQKFYKRPKPGKFDKEGNVIERR